MPLVIRNGHTKQFLSLAHQFRSECGLAPIAKWASGVFQQIQVEKSLYGPKSDGLAPNKTLARAALSLKVRPHAVLRSSHHLCIGQRLLS